MKQGLLISGYLIAIVTANLLTTIFGAGVSILNAFLFIGLDLTTRDYLHEIWRTGRWWKMGCLIVVGSLLSWAINQNAGKIAVASFAAFAASGVVDTIAYHLLRGKAHILKVNGSNVLSSATDSFLFPTIAFGSIMPLITLGQFAAKVLGGFVWYWILRRFHVVVVTSQKSKAQV